MDCGLIQRIQHCYLEAGHTQNERDSMHAVIERACKQSQSCIHILMQWYTLASSAEKSGRPYTLTEIEGQKALQVLKHTGTYFITAPFALNFRPRQQWPSFGSAC